MARLLTFVILGTCAFGCIEPKIDKPVAPDTDELTTDYAGATADLETAMMGAAIAEAEAAMASTSSVCGWESIDDLLCATPEECNALFNCAGLAETRDLANDVRQLVLDATSSDGDTIETGDGDEVFTTPFKQFEGFVTVRRRCSGLGDVGTLDEANGQIVLTAGFTNLTLDPVIWADFEGCQARVIDLPVSSLTITGRLVVVLSDGQVSPDSDIFLLSGFDLEIQTELGTADIAGSFLYEPSSERLVVLVRLSSGETLLFYTSPGSAGFIAANGVYECDFAAHRCTTAGGSDVTW